MKNIKLMNKIAAVGTDIFDRAEYTVDAELPLELADALMVRCTSTGTVTRLPGSASPMRTEITVQ